MFDKLDDILIHYEELMLELGNPSVTEDQNRFRRLMKEQADLAPLVETYTEYKKAKTAVEDSLAILDEENDEEMRELAKEELSDAKKQIEALEQELKITRDYLKIMQKRYPGCFYFETSMEPEVLSCCIPKLTLQPLVENSIIHGLQLFTSDRAGLITITGYTEDSLICLKITDNGSGMDDETVARLNSQIFSEERSSFGIHSIKKRLKLYFAVADIVVTSKIAEGTVITIRISRQQENPDRKD